MASTLREVDTGSSSDVNEPAEQAAGFSGRTREPGHWDDVIMDSPTAARREDVEQGAKEGDVHATKRRLETLLQLETHARRSMEENLYRVKGLNFSFRFYRPFLPK